MSGRASRPTPETNSRDFAVAKSAGFSAESCSRPPSAVIRGPTRRLPAAARTEPRRLWSTHRSRAECHGLRGFAARWYPRGLAHSAPLASCRSNVRGAALSLQHNPCASGFHGGRAGHRARVSKISRSARGTDRTSSVNSSTRTKPSGLSARNVPPMRTRPSSRSAITRRV